MLDVVTEDELKAAGYTFEKDGQLYKARLNGTLIAVSYFWGAVEASARTMYRRRIREAEQ